MTRSAQQVAVDVYAATVQVNDVILIGGHPMKVQALTRLHGGAKRLVFYSGETLTMSPRTKFTAFRTAKGW